MNKKIARDKLPLNYFLFKKSLKPLKSIHVLYKKIRRSGQIYNLLNSRQYIEDLFFKLEKLCASLFRFCYFNELRYQLNIRNNMIKLQSLVHNQLTSPRYTNLFKYAWYKSGYIAEKPGKFKNPVNFSFF